MDRFFLKRESLCRVGYSNNEFQLHELSANLHIGNMVFKEDKFLGCITNKMATHICVEFLKYGYENYRDKTIDYSNFEKSLDKLLLWIDNDELVSDNEIFHEIDYFYKNQINCLEKALYISFRHYEQYLVEDILKSIKPTCHKTWNPYYCAEYIIRERNDNIDYGDSFPEQIRQGEFIINFLESGESLFYI